ncbi:MAG: DUF1566 domain-containing protein [Leptospiraceae bacterium]|nr:DUF1566 domain-containing protein [Leptospiraceae bacterium]
MKQFLSKLSVIFLFLSFGLGSDSLTLKNGKEYENVYTKINKDTIDITLDGKKITFSKSEVKSIKKKEVVAKKAESTETNQPEEPSTNIEYKAPSFKDNGNGTVTDTANKLIWQKCSIGQTGETCGGFLIFGGAKKKNWDDAIRECNASTLAGKKWKLPSIDELKTLIKERDIRPTIDTEFFPNTIDYDYWSSTSYISNTSVAWVVFFVNGTVITNDKSLNNYVRCVSGL